MKLFTNGVDNANFSNEMFERIKSGGDIDIASPFVGHKCFIKKALDENCSIRLIMRVCISNNPDIIKEILEHENKDNIEIRFFTGDNFHSKIYIFKNAEKAYIGSSNLTNKGFDGNQEVNILIEKNSLNEKEVYEELEKTFEQYWAKSETLSHEKIEEWKETLKGREKNIVGYLRDLDKKLSSNENLQCIFPYEKPKRDESPVSENADLQIESSNTTHTSTHTSTTSNKKIDNILQKQTNGEKLTKEEEKLLKQKRLYDQLLEECRQRGVTLPQEVLDDLQAICNGAKHGSTVYKFYDAKDRGILHGSTGKPVEMVIQKLGTTTDRHWFGIADSKNKVEHPKILTKFLTPKNPDHNTVQPNSNSMKQGWKLVPIRKYEED